MLSCTHRFANFQGSLGDRVVSVAFKTWPGVGKHPENAAGITEAISGLGFHLPNRLLRELVMTLIGSIYLIPCRIILHKPAAGKVLKSINERERREERVENVGPEAGGQAGH